MGKNLEQEQSSAVNNKAGNRQKKAQKVIVEESTQKPNKKEKAEKKNNKIEEEHNQVKSKEKKNEAKEKTVEKVSKKSKRIKKTNKPKPAEEVKKPKAIPLIPKIENYADFVNTENTKIQKIRQRTIAKIKLDKNLIKKAVKSLLQYSHKKLNPKDLLETGDSFIYLEITLSQVPEKYSIRPLAMYNEYIYIYKYISIC